MPRLGLATRFEHGLHKGSEFNFAVKTRMRVDRPEARNGVRPPAKLDRTASRRCQVMCATRSASVQIGTTVCQQAASGRIALALVQLEIHLEDIEQLLADHATPRRAPLHLKDRLDVLAHIVDFDLLVVRLLGRHAVKVELGVLKRDVGVKARSGGSHQIAGNVIERDVRMIRPPRVEEDRLDIRSRLDRLNVGRLFAIRPRLGHRGREHAGMLIRERLEEEYSEGRTPSAAESQDFS